MSSIGQVSELIPFQQGAAHWGLFIIIHTHHVEKFYYVIIRTITD